MKKQIIFETDSHLIIFKDSNIESSYYCMTEDVLKEKMKITEEHGRDKYNVINESNVPDNYTIKVTPLTKVDSKDSFTDIYRLSTSETVDFPINRIEWMWIRINQA